MGGLALAAAAVCVTLPETHNQPTIENLLQDEPCEQNKRDKKSDDEVLTTGV